MLPLPGKERDKKTTNRVADKWRNRIGDAHHKHCITRQGELYIPLYLSFADYTPLVFSCPLEYMSEDEKMLLAPHHTQICGNLAAKRNLYFLADRKTVKMQKIQHGQVKISAAFLR
jgi:hypothetical protein